MEEEYIYLNEAAQLLKCGRTTMYKMLNKKLLDYYRNPRNNRILLKKKDVLALLKPTKGS